MKRINVQSLNECFNVQGLNCIELDDDYEQPIYNQPWNKGLIGVYEHSEETKKKITGRPPGFNHSNKWKENKSLSMKGDDNHFYGKKHNQDTKQKITARHRKNYKFVSPTGEIWEEFTTIKEFARKLNKCTKTIKSKWTVEELSQSPL
jgi:hypothetical protein